MALGASARNAPHRARRPHAAVVDHASRDDAQVRAAVSRGPAEARAVLSRRGAALERLTVGYNAIEGLAAIAAGLVAGSVALTGFGLDSVIEVASGVLLWWRLRAELGVAHLGPAVETRAARWAAALLLALAVYTVPDSAPRPSNAP